MGNHQSEHKDAYISTTLSDEVIEYLMEQLPECEKREFHIDGHTYYEGYYHCVNTTEHINSIHPYYGVEMDKMPAPKHFVKFMHVFQDLNKSWIDKFYQNLPKNNVGNIFRKWIDNKWHFADIAIQIHYGVEISTDQISWHTDTVNSLLHLALSLNGRRSLHTKTSIMEQLKGNIYLSSSWSFVHGVSYDECTNDDKIVAVQCRFLMTLEDWLTISEYVQNDKNKKELIKLVTSVISSANIILPTIDDLMR